MNSKTLKALRGSIRKWEKIVDGTGGDKPGNCPLCEQFCLDGCTDGDHEQCPVAIKRLPGCYETPYDEWIDAAGYKRGFGHIADTEEARAIARKELAFLKSLLPKGKKK